MFPENGRTFLIPNYDMKIVILDGFTANPGDLDWKRLESLGDLTVYDRTDSSLVVERCRDAEIVFTNKTPLTGHDIEMLPNLRFIGVLATGYNVVDLTATESKGITVCNVPSYSTMSVAQNVFALLLEITNRVGHYSRKVKEGKWCECEDFCFADTPLMELSGKQIGIVGYGSIGRRVAAIATAFGMSVAVYTSKSREEVLPAMKMDMDNLFATSDVISLHCPLTESTYHLVDKTRLGLMKKSAILINTGRGDLVDEEALAEALKNGSIAAAGVDVLSNEPPRRNNVLLKAPNVVITPHISWATKEARKRLINISVSNLEAFLEGHPRNVVSR